MERMQVLNGAIPLDSVLRTHELSRRPSRPPDHAAEIRALTELARALADSPRTILQKLAEVARLCCGADSAGISLLATNDGGRSFVWPAVSGPLSPYVGGGTPRNFGPCGVVLDRNAMQLFVRPERYYPYLEPITPPLEEVLLIPFHVRGEAVGTVWLVSHRPERRFDAEDLRLITSLGTFASAAYQVLQTLDALDHERVSLRESESQFRKMADTAPALLWVCEADGSCSFLSRSWYEFTGQTEGVALGFGWLDALHPDDRAQAERTFLQASVRHEPFSIDYRVRRADGEYRWALDSGRPRFGAQGEYLGQIGSVIEVHERKMSEERLHLLWEAAAILLATEDDPDLMMRRLFAKVSQHLDVDTYFNFIVNETGDGLRLVSCTGIPEETVRTIQQLEFGQAICGTVALHRKPIVATHIQQSDEPTHQLVKSFGIRTYACVPLLADNRLIGTLSFASRNKDRFQQDEVAFLETLSHYVTMAYERLRLIEGLRDADRRKDEFLATLAHELRNPLAPMRNALELQRHCGGNVESIEQARIIMERQVVQMVRLVDDLLDVARITRGMLELRREQVELAAVIKNAVETSRPLIEPMGHELSVTLAPEPIRLDADPVRLAQVFSNLLNNAAKYTEPGGSIRLTATREGSDALVSIEDTGVGIPADRLSLIFDLFAQVDKAMNRSQGGLGLGLTLVKRLTEMHGGSVEAKSEGLGRGSTFLVRLPVAARQLVTDFPCREGPVDSAHRRILVVDDNRDGANSLSALLRILGHKVQTAYDGIEAVQLAEGFRPDVILLDIGLPKLNGYEVCRRIRQEAWGKLMVVVAVTGWGQEEDRRRALEAGCDVHLVKPLHPADLEKVIAGLEPAST